ncbi:uncharacterized protein EHS24_007966 [Apiotrichum porosum]|uniref:Uncharacterized protein n=1 Tax=Apiotrichum porosum TaxID=105984 RepID=A0A427XSF7_9TREE|nr:uncharacterized protein EHS24_007966 [Apiotrichum porosum]RSH81774.1 hypothetical protein EHS24_007966 [Apiotrichum porosum]
MSAELAELGSELGIRSARAMFAAMSTHAAAITRSSSPTTAAPEGGPSTSTGGGVNSPPASISSSSSSDSPPHPYEAACSGDILPAGSYLVHAADLARASRPTTPFLPAPRASPASEDAAPRGRVRQFQLGGM